MREEQGLSGSGATAVVEQIRGIAANPDVVADVVRQLDEQRAAGVDGLEREKRSSRMNFSASGRRPPASSA